MRVSNATLYSFLNRSFERANRDNLSALTKLSDLKNVRYVSDDPAAARTALALRNRSLRIDGYDRNTKQARADLESIEDALAQVHALLIEVRNHADLGALENAEVQASAVESLRESLVQLANTHQDDRYLFGGTEVLSPPFDATGTYSGDNVEATALVDEERSVGTTLDGERVFTGAGDLFAVLEDLAADLRALDDAAVVQHHADFSDYLDHVAGIRAEVGIRLQRLEEHETRLTAEQERIVERLANLEDATLEETLVELTASTTAYDALSAASGRIIGRSLLDYIG